ncbi:MAG: hypothetical protein AB1644_01170 [Candidatus Zixiibacteriota bacterium]
MTRIRTLAALVLLVVLGIATTTWSVSSPYGRHGLARTEPGDDHPWGGNGYTEPIGDISSSGSTSVSQPRITGHLLIDLFFYRFILPGLLPESKTVPATEQPSSLPSNLGTTGAASNGSGHSTGAGN